MRTPGTRGTAVERRPGVWLVQASRPGGGKISRSVYLKGVTRRSDGHRPLEVQKALAAIVAEADSMEPETQRPVDVPFAEVAAEWLAAGEIAHSTRYNYSLYLKRYVLPVLGETKVRAISAASLEWLYSDMKQAGYGPATTRQAHAVIRSALHYALRRGIVDVNVALQASPPAGHGGGEVVSPSTDEVVALLAACGDDLAMHTFITLSAALGTRRSETCALRWNRVNFAEGSITVDAALYNCPGHQGELKATKTYSVGTLAVGPKVMEVLRAYRDSLGDPDGFVFGGLRPWTPQHATMRFTAVRARAGLGSHVKLKNLRHYHATQLISHGVDIRTVAGRLRHANPATTMAFYAKFDKRADRAAAGVYDELA